MKNILNIKIIGLIVLIVLLSAGIIIVYTILQQEDKKPETVQKVTKLEVKTYAKNIIINPSPTAVLLTPKISISPAVTPTSSITTTPQPTDIVVVYVRPTITSFAGNQGVPSPTITSIQVTPTRVISPTLKASVSPTQSRLAVLPKAGQWYATAILGLAAGFIIILSFVI